ncbi:MAG: DUF1624 domain-containing protein [Vicinamibacteraceae bacterium]
MNVGWTRPADAVISAGIPSVARHAAIDAVRGLVMVVMALDHVRDFVHVGAMSFSPEDLSRTTPVLFLTRWVTHICAPAFVFLAGLAAQRRLRRDRSTSRPAVYLTTRGLWLILVEVTLLRFALNFRIFGGDPWLLLVLCALGLSMLVLAPLVALRARVVAALGVAIVALHNLVDPVQAQELGALAPAWLLLHQQGIIPIAGQIVVVGYPMLPWVGVLALGFAAGVLYDTDASTRHRTLVWTGTAALVGFVALRALNLYGDPQPWTAQTTPVYTMLSFLRTTKYPPSLLFLLMTLGPVLLALAWFERRSATASHPLAVLGRVPLFYYLGHFLLAHVVASCLVWGRYGDFSLAFLSGPFPSVGGARETFPPDIGWPLWVAYLVWLFVVLAMYPVCVWYGRLKSRHRGAWWVGYL